MKALPWCCNGRAHGPVEPPSLVLCRECFDVLTGRIELLAKPSLFGCPHGNPPGTARDCACRMEER